MLFVNGGNDRIGIANSAPLTKLDIQASADNEDLIRLSHPTSASAAGALLGFNSDGTTDNNVITLGIHYSSDFYDVLNIQRSTRNVGIGTVNPQEQLDITSNSPRIRFTDLSVTNLRHVIGSEANDLEIRCDDGNVQATSHIGFKSDGSEKVRMTDTGRVGIGTSSPSEKLEVNGTIKATDFVGANTPAWSAKRSSAQTGIANNTSVLIICDSEDFDTDSAYNTSTGKFTVPSGKGGKYMVGAAFRTNGSGASTRLATILFVGSNVVRQTNFNQVSSGEASGACHAVLNLSAGNEVSFKIFQNSGSTINAEANGKTYFYGYKIG